LEHHIAKRWHEQGVTVRLCSGNCAERRYPEPTALIVDQDGLFDLQGDFLCKFAGYQIRRPTDSVGHHELDRSAGPGHDGLGESHSGRNRQRCQQSGNPLPPRS
jgi:hypothetical protein